MKINIKATIAAALALGVSSGLAVDYTITTAATADWNITTNWTPNTPSTSEPGAGDSVIFTNPVSGQYSQYMTTRSITNLTANNTTNEISLRPVGTGTGGQILTVTGTLQKDGAGSFWIGGGYAGTVNATGTLNLNAGTFGFRAESWAAGNLNLTGATVNLNGGTFWVARTGSAAALTWGSGAINLGGNTTIEATNYVNQTGRYFAGSGNVTINSNNSYDLYTSGATNSGTVAVTGGNLRLRGGATGTGKIGDTARVDLTNTSTTLTLNGSDGANANDETIGYLTGGASTFVLVNNNALTLSGNNVTAATYSGQITYNNGTGGSLIKNGSGVQILAGANGYTGATTINGGELRLAATGTLTESSGITITAGSLVLEAADRIVNTADLTLSGGTFNVGGFSETLDILTTTTGSILDFGSGSSTLLFSSLAGYSGVLAITNWTSGSDSLRFTSGVGLDAGAFSVNGGAASIVDQGTYFEVVPEPATWALLAGGLTTLMVFRRRRRN